MTAQISQGGQRAAGRGDQTRRQLIECAESLFAREGIDAVSLRQIGQAVGSSNTNIVGYHFGTKTDLINAIFEHRLPWLEARREALYGRCRDAGSADLHGLLYVLYRPLYEQTNDEGRHSYAGFLSELIRSGYGEMRRTLAPQYGVADRVNTEIMACLPGLEPPLLDGRLHTAVSIVTTSLQTIDRLSADSLTAGLGESLFLDGLNMAAAALTAPTDDACFRDLR